MFKLQIIREHDVVINSNIKSELRLELKLKLNHLNVIFHCHQLFTERYLRVYLSMLDLVALHSLIEAWVPSVMCK
jgi:hypothetical protein